jgi:DNA-binding CsgD family transcriptional regulator
MKDSSLVDKKAIIKSLYYEGYTHSQISRVLNLSPSRVSQVLLSEGVKIRPGRITEDMVNTFYTQYKQGIAVDKIAKYNNVSNAAVKKHLRLRGCDIPNNHITTQDLQLMMYYRKMGKTKAEIARLMQKSVQTITKHLEKCKEGNQNDDK